MLEENVYFKNIDEQIDQLKRIISYIAETQMTNVRFSHLDWCRDKDQNIIECSCGARQLNNLMGR